MNSFYHIVNNAFRNRILLGAWLLINLLGGCKKLIEVDPPIQSIIGGEIYSTNSGAASVLTGIYVTMSDGSFVHGLSGISLGAGLSADEFTLFAGASNQGLEYLYQNASNSALANSFWSSLYGYVFKSNAAIEGITASTRLTDQVRDQLLGEAKFLRAFCYFYLVNLYGDVPLLLSTDHSMNANASRSKKEDVYLQMITDLVDAQKLLSDKYIAADAVSTTDERVRPSRQAATALLARVYLFSGDWSKAEIESSKIIADAGYSLVALNEVFLMNSRETIWSLQSRVATINNLDGLVFNLLSTDNGPNSSRPVYLSEQLWNDFETGDNRKSQWVKTLTANGVVYPYVNKYKTDLNSVDVSEYPMMLRLGELYLIRAEARARQGKIVGNAAALDDLNAIRVRAGLNKILTGDQDEVLMAIDHERRIELFGEWGNRWLDLKRRGHIDQVMREISNSKGGVWAPFKALYPIPAYDIQTNSTLRGQQNPGYPES